jgi:HSP20 family molecular chaperone IbpA
MTNFLDKLKKGMDIEELPVENQNKEASAEKVEMPPVIKTEKKVKTKRAVTRVKKNEAEFASQNTDKPLIKFGPTEKQWSRQEGQPAVDIFQTDKEIIIQSALAGVKPENLEISINNDIVSFSGTRENCAEFAGKDYFRKECYWGSFFREIIMPEETETKDTKASFKEGILTLRIPKKLS